ncbi:MAG: hypothetical protein J0M24_26065 [Verrucomicrobia bacterium]|nr:hypothetical protein [Verrucomicrobiota bacterium]
MARARPDPHLRHRRDESNLLLLEIPLVGKGQRGFAKESRRPGTVAGAPAWIVAYFFLPVAAFLSATAWLFFLAAEEAAAFFWEDFFWLSFGERSPME